MITPQASRIAMIITHINEKAEGLHSYYHVVQLRIKSSACGFRCCDSKWVENSLNVMDVIIFNKALSTQFKISPCLLPLALPILGSPMLPLTLHELTMTLELFKCTWLC